MTRSERSGDLAAWVAGLLRWGTLVAVGIAAAGWIVAVVVGAPARADGTLVDRLAAGGGEAITAIGLLALTLLPLATMGVAALAFHRTGERRMTLVTFVVACLLVASLVVSAIVASVS